MNQVIHRQIAAFYGRTTLTVPADATIVNVQPSSNGWSVYYTCLEPDGAPAPTRTLELVSLKTGVPFPIGATYLMTIRGGLHLLSMTAAQAAAYDAQYPAINEADADTELPAHEPESSAAPADNDPDTNGE